MQITIDWSRGNRRWRTVKVFSNRWSARLYRQAMRLKGRMPFCPKPVRIQIVRW